MKGAREHAHVAWRRAVRKLSCRRASQWCEMQRVSESYQCRMIDGCKDSNGIRELSQQFDGPLSQQLRLFRRDELAVRSERVHNVFSIVSQDMI
eukprot:UN2797